jgi:hypothetical protein
MEVSGQLHAPAALPPGEQPPMSIVYEVESATGIGKEKNMLPLLRIKPRPLIS